MNRIHKLAIPVLLLMCVSLSGASAQSIAIKAEGGGDLPGSIYVGETFTVLITEDGSHVGAGTNVIFTLPQVGGTHIYVLTDDNGRARYKPPRTGTLGIKAMGGLVTVAEATVDVAYRPKTTPYTGGGGGGGGGGYYPPATPTVIATAAPTAPPGATPGVTPVVTPVKVVKTPVEVKTSAPTPKPPKKGIPGFTSVFAIAGLLAALYLVLRRRE